MPKIKKGRVNIKIDMTPMVDVAFLLLTFFMLATQFRPPEEVEVILPDSNSQSKLPESNVMTITIEKKGRVFIGFDSQRLMTQLFGEAAIGRISMETRLELLPDIITQARISNSKLQTVIKSDADAEYGVVNDIMQVLQEKAISKFAMITNLEMPKPNKQ